MHSFEVDPLLHPRRITRYELNRELNVLDPLEEYLQEPQRPPRAAQVYEPQEPLARGTPGLGASYSSMQREGAWVR